MPLISAIIPVFRDSERATATVGALQRCRLPSTYSLEIVVVDDGSHDGTAERLAQHFGECILLLSNPINLGRAATRNRGASSAQGEYLLFLDCDCAPADADFLTAHLSAIADADGSIGALQGTGEGFWHDYQALAQRRRQRLSSQHLDVLFSSANVMLARAAFLAAGGFDERYRGYGFEDRALALTLQQNGARLQLAPGALALHHDTLSLAAVCAKMRAAAGGNARLFGREFPDAYRRLGYAAIDARLHRWLRLPSRWLEPLRRFGLRWLEPRLESRRWPFALRAKAVRLLVAASYLRGSAEAATDSSKSR